jgi:hypothetical protein
VFYLTWYNECADLRRENHKTDPRHCVSTLPALDMKNRTSYWGVGRCTGRQRGAQRRRRWRLSVVVGGGGSNCVAWRGESPVRGDGESFVPWLIATE